MKTLLLALSLVSLPSISEACSLAPDFADAFKNDLTVELLRDYRVSGTVDNVRDLTITNLDVTPYYTYRGEIACPDSVKMSGTLSMNLMRKVSHDFKKRMELDRALSEGKITEEELRAELERTETCRVNATVSSVKAPRKQGEIAYRYDSTIGVEISCE